MTPMEYAQAACDGMMRRFAPQDLPPKGHFYYHQGVFLSGMYDAAMMCERDDYLQYIKDWMDSVIDADGQIIECVYSNLDDIMPGILLFPLWKQTGDERYRKGLESVYAEVKDIKRTDEGGFWHKVTLPGQMWLDGIYMAGPFCAQYADTFGVPELKKTVLKQMRLMKEHHRDEKTGLMYHAWDGTRQAEWADPETGRSPEFWGRSIGWVPVGMLNALDFIENGFEGRDEAVQMLTDLLISVCKYQSEDGRWYQVVDKGGKEGNWLENSCSCLFAAALFKAVRLGYLDASYLVPAKKAYDAVMRSIVWEDGEIQVGNVCVGTNVGGYRHYCERPVRSNDLHGVGTFLILCAEAARAGVE